MYSHPPRLRTRFVSAGTILLLLLFGYAPPTVAQAGPPVKPPELVGTSQTSFDIPFSIGRSNQSVVQVILHVSRDSGQTWQLHSTQPPGSQGFPFSSSEEGEYWFAIQTVNRNGIRQPAGNQLKPALRIVIDRNRPSLEFDVRPDAAGRIVGTVKASDPWINPRSLAIEYQVAGDGDNWKQVPARSSRQPRGGVLFDELAWWPQISGRELVIRATIQDVAGNSASVTRQMSLPLVAGAGGGAVTPTPATGPPANPPAAAANPTSRILTNYQQSRLPVALEHLYGNTPDPVPAQTRQAAKPEDPPGQSGWKPPGDVEKSPLSAWNNPVPQPPRAPNRLAQNTSNGALPVTSDQGNWNNRAPPWKSQTRPAPENQQQVSQASTAQWHPRNPVARNPVARNPVARNPVARNPVAATPIPAGDAAGATTTASHRVARQQTTGPVGKLPAPPLTTPDNPPGTSVITGNPGAPQSTVWPARRSPDQSPIIDPVGDSPPGSQVNAVWSSSTTGTVREEPPRTPGVMVSGPRFESLKKIARHSSSRHFQLEYNIDAIGPEGVKMVELWMTPDGGHSWRRLATDADRRSPVDAQVEEEGIFGFRIRVVSNQGLSARPPQRADPADIWVNVDTTLPEAAIVAAPYGTAADAGKLVIQWQARDDNLALRPINLKYSPQPDGPWTEIEQGLRNVGEFAWKPDVQTPERVWLRLEARDDAGNVRVHQPDRPIDISGLIPRGHIRGITPIAPAGPANPPPPDGKST